MTAYRNFTQDFPKRCLDLMKQASAKADYDERRVTWLLMVATSALNIPFEQVKPDGETPHPFGNNKFQSDLAEKLRALMESKFLDSPLCRKDLSGWEAAKGVNDVSGDLDAWIPDIGLKQISDEKSAGAILKHVRNALAHGNVHAKSKGAVTHLVFIQSQYKKQSEPSKGFAVLSVTIDAFEHFIRNWVAFLQKERVWELRLVA